MPDEFHDDETLFTSHEKFIWHGYLVLSLVICVHKTLTKTGLSHSRIFMIDYGCVEKTLLPLIIRH